MSRKYKFRREDNGKVVLVDFETMMGAENGFLRLEDGVMARRVSEGSCRISSSASEKRKSANPPKVISDALGFTHHQLTEMREHLARAPVPGIEFHPDPHVPQFYQVHCSSEKAKREYMAKRGFNDRNSRNGGGAEISPELLAGAVDMVMREWGE